MLNPEVLNHTSEIVLALAPPILVLLSRSNWLAVKERDPVDKWDDSSKNLEVAHINHDKGYPKRNELSNIRRISRRNHYLDHVNRVGRNGLTLAENNWALREIWQRLSDEERAGLMPPPEDTRR